MTENLQSLTDAIATLKTARVNAAGVSEFAWNKLYNAVQHLEKQVKEYFEN
jgi:hypothetical protein